MVQQRQDREHYITPEDIIYANDRDSILQVILVHGAMTPEQTQECQRLQDEGMSWTEAVAQVRAQ